MADGSDTTLTVEPATTAAGLREGWRRGGERVGAGAHRADASEQRSVAVDGSSAPFPLRTSSMSVAAREPSRAALVSGVPARTDLLHARQYRGRAVSGRSGQRPAP